jgi:predicted phosphoribosyltransferase
MRNTNDTVNLPDGKGPGAGATMLRDRIHGGQILAAELEQDFAGNPDAIVLALPRGGVPVAYEVARTLHLPMDVYVVRKLGVPGHEELAMGALATGGVRVINREVVDTYGIHPEEMEEATAREKQELARRERIYRDGRPAPQLHGKIVILIDDGLATGSTMRAAAAAARAQGARQAIIAAPVGAVSACQQLHPEADRVVCPFAPDSFYAVGEWYQSFPQITDDEVRELLDQATIEFPIAA